jgi:hypothetical protein
MHEARMKYQRFRLSTLQNIGPVRPLPAELVGLADESLSDLSWADPALGYGDFGFSPVPDPPPEPPRPQLPKSIVTARVTALGKAADVWALLNANPAMAFKWFSPDWPNVFLRRRNAVAGAHRHRSER